MPVFSKMSPPSPLYRNLYASDILYSSPSTRFGRQPPNTGRKSNKFTKSTNQRVAVWPPALEIALLEALAKYRPSSAKDSRLLQRFPGRNIYISRQISKKTGQERTAKQVGSRLQQLRETCPDPYVLNLIQSKDFGESSPILANPSFSPTSPSPLVGKWRSSEHSSLHLVGNRTISRLSSATSSEFSQDSTTLASSSLPHYSIQTVMVVTLVLFPFDYFASSPDISPSFTLDLDEHALTDASYPSSSAFTRRVEIRTTHAISRYIPIVNFSSRWFSLESRYQCITLVYRDDELVYSKPAYLEPCQLGSDSAALSMNLVPDFWAVVTRNPEDYHSHTIEQKIYPVSNSAVQSECPLFSIQYDLERGFNPPTYGSPELPPPPPYLDEVSWPSHLHDATQVDCPTSLSPQNSPYFNNETLSYPIPQVPDSLFYPLPFGQDLPSMSHELNHFPTYF